MAMTAATPMITPNTVRVERILCRRRLFRAVRKVGGIKAPDHGRLIGGGSGSWGGGAAAGGEPGGRVAVPKPSWGTVATAWLSGTGKG